MTIVLTMAGGAGQRIRLAAIGSAAPTRAAAAAASGGGGGGG